MSKMLTRLAVLLAVILLFVMLPSTAELYTEWLWFGETGYQSVFLNTLTTKGLVGTIAFLVVLVLLYGNLRAALRGPNRPYVLFPGGGDLRPLILDRTQLRLAAAVVAAVIALFIGAVASGYWLTWLQYRHATPFGETDPIFGRDVSFYVFALPFLDATRRLLLVAVTLSLLGAGGLYAITGGLALGGSRGVRVHPDARRHLLLLLAGLFGLIAWGAYLDIPRTLITPAGIIYGASYVDVLARIPMRRALLVIAALGAGASATSAFSWRTWPAAAAIGLYVAAALGGSAYALLLQRLVVTPDEQRKEATYITRNIEGTRRAFNLHHLEERELSGDAELSRDDIGENAETLNNVRLWDHQPLLDTFGQLQEIRTYYDFVSVDNDRYIIDGQYRQTMLSSRELNSSSLPNRSWVNERLQYTHGFGIAMGPVNQVVQEGLPMLFIQDLPPRASVDLEVEQPSIYFGEISNDYVIVNTRTDEFHYPQGEDNVSTRYDGRGGVPLGGMLGRLLFGLRFRSYEILVSSQLLPDSRVLFHRNISERFGRIAPFLRYDSDPYMVLSEGRLFWVRDAYTVTDHYPYATPVTRGINYIRNSVKVVIDAYHGTTTFYLADPDDPIAVTLGKIFPELLHPLDDMPADLRRHLRYPEDIFQLQAAMYSTYHMTNPAVFYNKEDQWEIPAIGNEQMQPYYTIMRLPGEDTAEFIQMLPFTPRGKNNLAAWMVARSDGPQYGRMLVFQFPKQKVIFGPSQIVARINQDQLISPQITLWNQQGSEVIQGTLLVIPIEEAMLYIRPLYLRASGGRIPELKRVIVAYQNQIVMAESLDRAIAQIFGSEEHVSPSLPVVDESGARPARAAAGGAESDPMALEAQDHYERAIKAQREGDWSLYGEEIRKLGEVLRRMTQGQALGAGR
jgi:uncharacterized membrane protein (UPF0182 family)